MLKKIERRIKRALFDPSNYIKKLVRPASLPLIRLGTSYGGWTLCDDAQLAGSRIISCGAGEDLSFDIEMIRKFDCDVVVVDPTRRAIEHFNELKESVRAAKPFAINRSKKDFYQCDETTLNHITWIEKAVWNKRATLNFWEPKDPTHVSHSLTNLQGSNRSVQVAATPVKDLLSELEMDSIPLIKLDIEGAEVEVILSMLKDQISPKQILVEFDELNILSSSSRKRVVSTTKSLLNAGYSLVHYDGKSNCLFTKF